MYSYAAFCLNFQSALPLPELLPGKGKAEINIKLDRIGPSPDKEGPIQCIENNSDETILAWGKIGTISVSNGKLIRVDPAGDASAEPLRTFILGAAMSILLHQRGLTLLHASAVMVNGKAVIFLGNRGTGKSTTAAAVCTRGHKLIADDLVAIQFDPQGIPYVLYGYPQIKLWPDILNYLGNNPETFPKVHPDINKRLVPTVISDPFSHYPIHHIYLLGDGDKTEAVSIPPQFLFNELIRSMYVSRFGSIMLGKEKAVNLFNQSVNLVKQAPIHLLRRKNDLAALTEIISLIENS